MKSLNDACRIMLAAVCTASPFLLFLALPSFDIGTWEEVATVSIGLHVAAGVSAALLAALLALGDRRARMAVTSPAVVAFGAIALWSFATAPLADDPWRSLHGTMKLGVGAIWHLEVAIMAAAFGAVWRGRVRTVLAAAAIISVTLALALTVMDGGERKIAPYSFPDWLPIAGALVAAAALMPSARKSIKLASVALLALATVVSQNLSMVALAAFLAASFAVLRARRWNSPQKWLAASCVFLAVAGVGAILAVGPAVESFATARLGDSRSPTIPSEDPRDHVSMVDSTMFGTLWSRSMMIKVVLEKVAEDPAAALRGIGWGSFNTAFLEGFRTVAGRTFVAALPTASLTLWDPHDKADFHSHNLFVESLLSIGVVGAALTVLAFVAPVLFVRRRALAGPLLLSSTLCVIGSLWFLMNSMAPFLALALAATASPARSLRIGRRAGQVAASVLAPLALALLVVSSIMLNVARTEWRERHFVPMLPIGAPPCGAVYGLGIPERDINVGLYRILVKKIESAPNPLAEFLPRVQNVRNYSCLLRTYIAHEPDVVTLDASLELRGRLVAALHGSVIESAIAPDLAAWEDDVRLMLKHAPERTDVAAPFVNWLASSARASELPRVARSLAAGMRADDPIRIWLEARVAAAEGRSDDHRRLLSKSLRHGLANLIPLPESAVRDVLAQGGAK